MDTHSLAQDTTLPAQHPARRRPAPAADWKQSLSVWAYGALTSTCFPAHAAPQTLRRRFERAGSSSRARLARRHPGLVFADHDVRGLHVESVTAVAEPRRVVVYLHGGAYLMGSPAVYRSRVARIGYRCEAEVLVPDYRLAPEHPFPAALDDAMHAIAWAAERHPGVPLYVAGDSAGGGLALAATIALAADGHPSPSGLFLFSPWTDLAVTGPSVEANQGRDRWLTRAHLEAWSAHYRGATDARHPLVSPLYADDAELAALPPVLVSVGDQEALLDDARRFAARARRAGAVVRLEEGRGMQHDFPIALPWLGESRRAWGEIRAFLASCERE